MAPPPENHDCGWRTEAERLRGRVEDLEAQLARYQRKTYGQSSEKMPSIKSELKRSEGNGRSRGEDLRRANAQTMAALPEKRIEHVVPEEKLKCPKCGGTHFRKVGPGRETTITEYVPSRFERHVHIQQTMACACGEHIVTAEGPVKIVEKGQYGPGFVAHLAVAKCADSIPLYRMEKQFARDGVPIARSTMVTLFNRAGELLSVLSQRILEMIAASEIVQADETPLKRQAKEKTATGYMWTFLTELCTGESLIGYKYSASRSGETPSNVLGASNGTLLVDAYSGYNKVCTPEKRERAGCMAHVRRKFFDALFTAPEAQTALDIILAIYRVEHEAAQLEIVGTEDHLRLRQENSAAIMKQFNNWLLQEQPKHLPKGPMGGAISYALNQWDALNKFLNDARIPVDNNSSERALRVVALGRKNFLFVGNELTGELLAGLYTLVHTCEANDINPELYIKDVLIRIQSHPQKQIDDLLPHRWKILYGTANKAGP